MYVEYNIINVERSEEITNLEAYKTIGMPNVPSLSGYSTLLLL